jgi:hypothetical protein
VPKSSKRAVTDHVLARIPRNYIAKALMSLPPAKDGADGRDGLLRERARARPAAHHRSAPRAHVRPVNALFLDG